MSRPLIRVPHPPILGELRQRHHAAIEASAGTGKTYTLEHLFIDLLIGSDGHQPVPIEQILLVTFTEKAALELSGRCHALLSRLIEMGARAPCQGELEGAASTCPGHCAVASPGAPCPCGATQWNCWTLGDRALERLRQAFACFDMANISTIHAFCQRALAEEAFQRGALFQEEVVDAQKLFARVFRHCLRQEFTRDDRCRWALEGWLKAGLPVVASRNSARPFSQETSLEALLHQVFKAGAGLPTQSKQMLRAQLAAGLAEELERAVCALKALLAEIGHADVATADPPACRPREALVSALEALRRAADQCGALGQQCQNLREVLSEEADWFDDYFYRAAPIAPALAADGEAEAAVRGGRLPDLSAVSALIDELERVGAVLAPEAAHIEARLRDIQRAIERLPMCFPQTLEACVASVLLPPLCRALDEEKRARGLIDYDDMLSRLDEALADPVRGQALAEHLRQSFRAMLIDEFQDTDEVQWRIFRRLIGDPVHPDCERDPRLVIIGDPKQSIYRFRGADLPTYEAARASLGGAPLRLETNFRTMASLVHAFNVLFDPEANLCSPDESAPFACERIGAAPTALPIEGAQLADGLNPGALAHAADWLQLPLSALDGTSVRETRAGFQLWPGRDSRFLNHADYGAPGVAAGNRRARAMLGNEVAAPLCLFALDVQGIASKAGANRGTVSQPKFFQALGWLIAQEIARLRDPATGFLFDIGKDESSDLRPLRLSDVFVLVRDRFSALKGIAAALDAFDIPYTFQDVGIFESDEACDLLDLLRAIAHPSDRSLVQRAALTPFFGLTLADLAQQGWDCADSSVARRLADWKRQAEERNYAALFERILGESGIQRRLLFAAHARPFANLSHLCDALLREIGSRSMAIEEVTGLLDGLMHRRREVEDDSDKLRPLNPPSLGEQHADSAGDAGDAVQIMTMHKAKGLEAPVVFVMDAIGPLKMEKAVSRPGRLGLPRSAYVTGTASREVTRGAALGEEVRLERDADAERLLYVAMTRAMIRLYLPMITPQSAVSGSGYARLNARLLALRRAPEPVPAGDAERSSPARSLREAADVGMRPPRPGALSRLVSALEAGHGLASIPEGMCPRSLAMTSYTRLTRGQVSCSDIEMIGEGGSGGMPRGHLEDHELPGDVCAHSRGDELPGGKASGSLLHALLEKLPIELAAQVQTDEALLAVPRFAALLDQAQSTHGLHLTEPQRRHAAHLVRMSLTTPLAIGAGGRPWRLVDLDIPPVHEMEFLFPIPEKNHPLLGDLMRRTAGAFEVGRGYVKGFIDIAFEHGGRTWIGDWKTDRLPDARPATLARHVEANYQIQVQLYTLALVRLLGIASRADFEQRIGGFLYFFVREMTGEPMRGVHLIRPHFDEVIAWERALLDTHFEHFTACRRFT